jgi:hypothetical protein
MHEPTSLVRFMNQTEGNGRGNLSWQRAGVDGAPFRGPPPLLREEEYEQRVVRVGDPQVRIFKISQDAPDEIKAYQEVMTKVVNGGWGQILHVDRQFNQAEGHWMVYLEWVQWYMEDGHPEAAQAQNHEQNQLPYTPNA